MRSYEALVSEAVAAHRDGWDFGWQTDRVRSTELSWSYPSLARTALASAASVVDVDTGGGELLAGFAADGLLPARAAATEGWPPNLVLARDRLAPLGVSVAEAVGGALPFDEGSFDLVLNRHGTLDADATARALAPGGALITQQVGSDDMAALNEMLGASPAHPADSWTLDVAAARLEAAGLVVDDARQEHGPFEFLDIGAVVFQLEAVAWQIPDFTPAHYDSSLRELDRRIRDVGSVTVRTHRFLVVARRP